MRSLNDPVASDPPEPEVERRIIVPRDDLPASCTATIGAADEHRLRPTIVLRRPRDHIERTIIGIERQRRFRPGTTERRRTVRGDNEVGDGVVRIATAECKIVRVIVMV